MNYTPKVTVVGSINMDLVAITDQLPKMGETIMGKQFGLNPGGKGANQAVAAARLGASVKMIGCIGDDLFGKDLLNNLQNEGIDTTGVEPVTDATGTATIIVADGDNSIIVVPGANHYVTAAYVESKRKLIADSDVLVVQLEIPLEGVEKAVEIAKECNIPVILNPAPICSLPEKLLKQIDYITPNEHEFEAMQKENQAIDLTEKLILTLGSKGVMFHDAGKEVIVPAHRVEVVDTTGAGDSFNGGLAYALGSGLPLKEACEFGTAVAALSVTKFGAQTGMPTKSEVSVFVKKN